MAKKLKLDMITNMGTTKTYTINDPKSNLTLSDINLIVGAMTGSDNPLEISGTKPTALKTAYYEETIRTDITE